jgi:hypothetical protein
MEPVFYVPPPPSAIITALQHQHPNTAATRPCATSLTAILRRAVVGTGLTKERTAHYDQQQQVHSSGPPPTNAWFEIASAAFSARLHPEVLDQLELHHHHH